MQDRKHAAAPMPKSYFESLDAGEDKSTVDLELNQQMIEYPLYLGLRSRPDMVLAVSQMSRPTNAPTPYCQRVARQVLRYLMSTIGHSVKFVDDVPVVMSVQVDFD